MKPYYQHAGITIYHGDCREILPQLPKGWCSTCSCVLADEQILAIHLAGEHKVGPLFELLLTDPPYGLNLSSDLWLYQRGKIAESSWDSEKFPAITSLLAYSKDAIIWGGNYYELPISRGWLSWFKPDAVPTMSQFELAWTSRDMVTRQFRYCIAETNAERCGHPTQKPGRGRI